MKKIIDQIIFLRKEIGMTQGELATFIGSKQQIVARIEAGETIPSLKQLCKITEVLGCVIKIEPGQL